MSDIDPHAGEPIATAGAPPQVTEAVVVLLHGRGDAPTGILRLVDDIYHRGVRYVAPAAAGRVWFPGSFADPLTERRRAYLDSALGQVDAARDVAGDIGVPSERVVVAGFSQGAALALEYVTRRPRRYGGVAALAGGLLGPTGELAPRPGSLAGTPTFCGVGEDDRAVSAAHVEASADVTAETYPSSGTLSATGKSRR